MKTKSKTTQLKIISVDDLEKVQIEQVNLRVLDSSTFQEAKKELLGKNAKPTNYGKGPFAYTGEANPSGSIFAGINNATQGEVIILKGNGASKLEEMIAHDHSLMKNVKCTKVEFAVYSPIPENFESGGATPNNVEKLKNLSSELSSESSKKNISFNGRSKQVEIGSKGGKLLKIKFVELKTKQEKVETMISYELDCVDCQASNILEAAKLDPKPKLSTIGASQILDLIGGLTSNNLIISILKNICEAYDFSDVTLSKRERTSITGLNSKVKYFRTGLNSCLNNFGVLDPKFQQQYIYCLQEFVHNLKSISANEKQYQELLTKLKESLDNPNVQQQTTSQYPRVDRPLKRKPSIAQQPTTPPNIQQDGGKVK